MSPEKDPAREHGYADRLPSATVVRSELVLKNVHNRSYRLNIEDQTVQNTRQEEHLQHVSHPIHPTIFDSLYQCRKASQA